MTKLGVPQQSQSQQLGLTMNNVHLNTVPYEIHPMQLKSGAPSAEHLVYLNNQMTAQQQIALFHHQQQQQQQFRNGQFCFRWENHQSTLIQYFDTLLESGTLVDCTLAAEGKTLKAHKVILSACSPYFECLLSEHYDKHPVFIFKDVKFKELKAMMDFMYRGEVNISQDQLAALLKAAESLQIKGLSEIKIAGSSKMESRPQETVLQPTAPSLDILHASSGLMIEKNKDPRQSLTQSSMGDLSEDLASPQMSKGLSSREISQSTTLKKRKKFRRKSLTEDSTVENQAASNSSDMLQQMGVPLDIAPVADEKVHADPTDSLGRSTLMTQLTKPADEMLLEKPKLEPNDNFIELKSEYLEDAEEGVEDLTLDKNTDDLNDMEQDNNRAGPSHDPAYHLAGLTSWHVTGDRSNAGSVFGSVAGAPGATDEVFLAAQEVAQAHRDSQFIRYRVAEKESSEKIQILLLVKEKKPSERKEKSFKQKETSVEERISRSYKRDDINDHPSTSTAQISADSIDRTHSVKSEFISLQNSKDVAKFENKFECPHCKIIYEQQHNLMNHIKMTCLLNPNSNAVKKPKFTCRFTCDKCGRSYKVMKSLLYHKKYLCNKIIQCSDCKKVFYGIRRITERHKKFHCLTQTTQSKCEERRITGRTIYRRRVSSN